jgi:micrococcal nuclease
MEESVNEYPAMALHIVDGDTLDVVVDLGFRIDFEQRIRLYGINTPERGQPGFKEATEALGKLVMLQPLVCRTIKPHEKYGRWLASIHTPETPDVAAAMIDAGFGVPYFGSSLQGWNDV